MSFRQLLHEGKNLSDFLFGEFLQENIELVTTGNHLGSHGVCAQVLKTPRAITAGNKDTIAHL